MAAEKVTTLGASPAARISSSSARASWKGRCPCAHALSASVYITSSGAEAATVPSLSLLGFSLARCPSACSRRTVSTTSS